MPSQAQEHPNLTNQPIAEGVQHGPYRRTGDEVFSQSNGLDNAIEAANTAGDISSEQYLKLGEGVTALAEQEFEEYDRADVGQEVSQAEQDAHSAHVARQHGDFNG